jgi:hypothetical protein
MPARSYGAFHALYAGDEAEIAIHPLVILEGRLPPLR